jgi:hypothetical protein
MVIPPVARSWGFYLNRKELMKQNENNNIVYCVVQIDWTWTTNEPRPSIIATYGNREDAIQKQDLMKKIAHIDQSKMQFKVISITYEERNASKKTD